MVIKQTKKPKTETNSLPKEETEKRSMECHQTKTKNRNTKEKNKWRHRATRKQKIKWLYAVLIHQQLPLT